MSKSLNLLAGTALAAGLAASPALAEKMGLGRAALPEEIAAWDVSVLPKSYNERKGGVVHLLDNGTSVVIPVKTLCSTRVTTNCVVSYGYSADGLTYSIVFRTPTNGSTRGF